MQTYVVITQLQPTGMMRRKHIKLNTEKHTLGAGCLIDKKTGKILGRVNQVYSE